MREFLGSLKARLTLLVLITAIPGLVALIYGAVIEREQAIKLALDRAKNTVDVSIGFQAHVIEDTKFYLRNLASYPALQQPTSSSCKAFIADALKLNTSYVNLGVPTSSGDLYCNALPLDHAVNVADRAYFQEALNNRSFSIGEFQTDRAVGKTSVNFGYPVVDPVENNVVGVAVAVISLDWWSKKLAESSLPSNSTAYILDEDSRILAVFPQNPSLLGKVVGEVEKQFRLRTALQNERTNFLVIDSLQRVFVSQPLLQDTDKITVVVSVPFSEELALRNSRILKLSIILIAFVALVLWGAKFGVQRTIMDPLEKLISFTRALELGEQVGEIPQQGSSEFKSLQMRFTSMAKTRLEVERKLRASQEQLIENESELSSHIENTPLGCISWNRDLICTKWNKSAERIFGYTKAEAVGKAAKDLMLLPETEEDVTSLFLQFIENNTESIATAINDNRTKSGKLITCQWYSTLICDSEGEVKSVTSLVQDISENKALENKLKLAASVFSDAQEGIFITDKNGVIVDVNDTFTKITGFSRQDAIGKNPNILKSDRHPPEFYQHLWQCLFHDGYWSGEIYNRRKNGEVYVQHLTISVVKDSADQTVNYSAIFTDISELKDHQFKLEKMAHYDVLTNLPNRSLLAKKLDAAIKDSNQNHTLVGVALLDLDGFKEVNDLHGHSVGDELLVALSKRLRSMLSVSDTISRFGGDEFVIVLTNLKEEADALKVIQRLLTAASDPVSCGAHILNVSASIGLTLYPIDNTDPDQLIRHADQAMYLAKQKGKNCAHIFDIEIEDAAKQQHEKVQSIALALERREFTLYFQPKINMKSGDIVGVEALVRWNHPEKGVLSPSEFLPYIENHQLSIELDHWVITEALHQLNLWVSSEITIPVSVNVGALKIQQQDFAECLQEQLENMPHVPPNLLQLEVLETSELEDVRKVSQTMKKCVELGVNFSIDDFGTGYSSLTYLRRLPVKEIKIDQTFVRDMLVDPEDREIVKGVIALAKSFNLSVVAEGVETKQHGTRLLELGCELAQGYGIARPMPASDLLLWIDNWSNHHKWQE